MEVAKLEDSSDWELPKDAAAAVASATVLEGIEAEELVVSRPSSEVFPFPIPTAGTFPVSFPVPDDELALAVEDIEGPEVSVLLDAGALVVAATADCVTGIEELKRDRSDVLPPPTPTAGTLPFSVPDPEAMAALFWVVIVVDVAGDAPVAAARR